MSLLLAAGAAPARAQDWGDGEPATDTWEEGQDAGDGSEIVDVPDVVDAPDLDTDWLDPDEDEDELEDESLLDRLPLVTTATVPGKVARLRTNGEAAIPRGAPARVRAIIRAANRIVGKPYKWGGGHARVEDRGYDCSGAVSYPLIRAKHLARPLVSGSFARFGAAGAGKWVTIYANKRHVYMEVAGLRLDTSTAGDYRDRSGVRWRAPMGKRSGFKVRHPIGL